MFLNKQALKCILLSALSFTSTFEVVKGADHISFRESYYSSQYNTTVDSELDKINPTILAQLAAYGVISRSSPGYGDAVFAFHTLSFLTPAPPSCSEQSFGTDGKWTNTICTAYDTAVDICTNDESSSCDSASFYKIMAGKVSNMESNEFATSMLICLDMNGTSENAIAQCSTLVQSGYFSQTIQDLFYLIKIYVPFGFDNVLLSNARGMLLPTGEGITDPNSHYVIGDGKLSIYEQILRTRKSNLLVKYVSGPLLLARNYKKHNTVQNTNAALDVLIEDALGGHYSQKYAERFFNVEERRIFSRLVDDTFVTECGAAIGIIATTKCGFGPEEIVSFLQYYDSLLTGEYANDSERYCSLVTSIHYGKAKRFMRTHEKDLPNIGGRNPNRKCLKKFQWVGLLNV